MSNKINTLIGSDIVIKGDIIYNGTVHVEASVEGSLISSKNKESKLYINKSSVIRGFVDASNVAINGTVYGNVYVYDLLQLGSDAFIKGNIYYKSIEMEVGAKIDGRLVVCDSKEELDLHKIDIESKGNSTTIKGN
ncbi:MAG: polymer-forming cytoskeletal protein [Gammaproteobacteria bacterium]|jgi:cytoskeletal protein CcmA (bactofilin family)|nr:polymer-forming cytoskeletal protein [Gammaproteobacteria bacterium]MBT7523696.1 polymer-forming cytoskeletal protein [Gammaproteobacteria bacterium]MBT7814582.1 polymer-forming cytoskeletal protein [Gammaproteobacteria bacterium]|tara:strand:- start:2170 stop:2577 length:408 start_codon:yes stop_codon:yes gene_type:complete